MSDIKPLTGIGRYSSNVSDITVLAGKCASEYLIRQVSKLSAAVYSPPIATTPDTFWELEFIASFEHDPDYCCFFLTAIPNDQESRSLIWPKRKTYKAYIYLKDPDTNEIIEKKPIEHEFNLKEPSWGHFTFCPMSSLPSSDQVIIGVEFDHSELSSNSRHNALPGPSIPNDLIEAWGEQVDNPATADVRFNLSGHFVYANSAILSQRCRYLKYMFEGEWASEKNQNKRESVDSVRSFQGRSSKYKYLVDINDFHHLTFLEMLRFLYTDQVQFEEDPDLHCTPIEVYAIADKYFIYELRNRAKIEIWDNLDVDNCAMILFGTAAQWKDLRDDILDYVVANFSKVKDTKGFKEILCNPEDYPMFGELWVEIMSLTKSK